MMAAAAVAAAAASNGGGVVFASDARRQIVADASIDWICPNSVGLVRCGRRASNVFAFK
jgi:hypothetical protein